VGEQTIDGKPVDHVALRNDAVGVQLWVERGERPLPHRLVVTYEQAPGQPQFRAELREWDLSPRLRDGHFAFEPPEAAEKIAFAPQLIPAAMKGEGR
jgi:hypothetical protein